MDRIVRTIIAVAFAAAVAVAAPAPVRASADVFEVRDVPVDVTDDTATKARTQALAQGERAALQRLFKRLTLSGDWSRLPNPSSDQRAALVYDFDVAEEKTSGVRYLAKLSYRFKADGVRRVLRDWGLRFAETRSKPLLVVPIYRAAGTARLWDDPNPWLDAWRTRPVLDGLVPLVVPLGDLTDIGTLGAEQAVQGDEAAIAALAARYGAGDALVVVGAARPGGDGGLAALDVTQVRHGSLAMNAPLGVSFAGRQGESALETMQRAVLGVMVRIEDDWKRGNLLQFGQQAVLALAVPVRSLREWLVIRKRLDGVAVVRGVEVVLMSRDEVRVNLEFIGGVDQLTVALQQADLTLSEAEGVWRLETTGAARARQP